jgi:hypothetical protein
MTDKMQPVGTSVFFPSGPLGNATTTRDYSELNADILTHEAGLAVDIEAATIAITAVSAILLLSQFLTERVFVFVGWRYHDIGGLRYPL